MKMQKYFDDAVQMTQEFIERHGSSVVRVYMDNVRNSGNYSDYDTRISNDIVKYAVVGCCRMIDWANDCDANDKHITTFCVAVMRKVGLLK